MNVSVTIMQVKIERDQNQIIYHDKPDCH